MAQDTSFPSRSGAAVTGALSLPPGDAPAPAVVLIHEWWGLNQHIRSLLDRLAAEGFIAIAPDLYHGTVAAAGDDATASRLMTELQWTSALDELAGAVAFAKAHPRSSGAVGVTGFCMGGAGAFIAACSVPGLAAAVPFYGVPPARYVDWRTAEPPPIQAHFSSRDQWAKVSAANEILEALTARGKSMELHVYDAEHAFVNDTRPEVYHPQHAALAWRRAMDFLREHLRAGA